MGLCQDGGVVRLAILEMIEDVFDVLAGVFEFDGAALIINAPAGRGLNSERLKFVLYLQKRNIGIDPDVSFHLYNFFSHINPA